MSNIHTLFDLTGKVAIVTGAGSGLGVTFAEGLAEAGAKVVCSGRRMDNIQKTAQKLQDAGLEAIAIQADVADETSVENLVKETLDRYGRVDILVNNAGVANVGPPESVPLSEWKHVVDVNLTGVFLCSQVVARAMIEARNGGSIINIASILGAGASEPSAATAYAATKGGVVNLTRDLAVHWAPHNIRVNAIGPAYFPSEMTAGLMDLPEVVAEIERRTPAGRMGRPEELKGPAIFLASDAASYVTGDILYVDGGWTAW